MDREINRQTVRLIDGYTNIQTNGKMDKQSEKRRETGKTQICTW